MKDDNEVNHPDYRPTDNVKGPRAYGQYVMRQKAERQAKLDKAAEEERLASLNKKDVIEAAKQAERLLESQKAASKEKAELSELMRAKNDEENRMIQELAQKTKEVKETLRVEMREGEKDGGDGK